MGHALLGVIDHHRQLVGEQAVGAMEQKIPRVLRQRLHDRALYRIFKRDLRIADTHAHRARGFAPREAPAAGARVDGRAVAGEQAVADFTARAGARVGVAGGAKLFQGRLVRGGAPALVQDLVVPGEAVRGKRGKNRRSGAGLLAWPVNIFHAHQPLAAVRVRVQIAAGCSHE